MSLNRYLAFLLPENTEYGYSKFNTEMYTKLSHEFCGLREVEELFKKFSKPDENGCNDEGSLEFLSLLKLHNISLYKAFLFSVLKIYHEEQTNGNVKKKAPIAMGESYSFPDINFELLSDVFERGWKIRE